MKELLFRVADKCMAEAIAGVFDRPAWEQVIGCRRFDFDSRRDIRVAAGRNDCGLYSDGCELVRPFHGEYRRVVMLVDEAWDGSPGQAAIEAKLQEHVIRAGWAEDDGLPLVVCPEVDVWLWSDSPHSASALGWDSWDELRRALQTEGWLNGDDAKPTRPKEAADWAVRRGSKRVIRSSVIYRQVAAKVSLTRCTDGALTRLIQRLRAWFPVEGA